MPLIFLYPLFLCFKLLPPVIVWRGAGKNITAMAYFNYHAKVKKLISEGHLTGYKIVNNWNGISPALVLYFDNNPPMPIREYRWDEYFKMIGITFINNDRPY